MRQEAELGEALSASLREELSPLALKCKFSPLFYTISRVRDRHRVLGEYVYLYLCLCVVCAESDVYGVCECM